MSERINLTQLRHDVELGGPSMPDEALLALIDAVQAAHGIIDDGLATLDQHMSKDVEVRTRQGFIEAAQRLSEALDRFDFDA